MPGRSSRRSWFALAPSLLVALETATPVWAWGRLGHRVTSRIAEKYRTIAMKGTVEEWATESLLAARAAYVVPGTEARIKSGQKLAKSYQDANLPVIRQRLYQSGVRLATVLNEVFEGKL